MLTINKILVPTDFSENASNAYSHAQQIASRHGAKVDFIHIIPTLQYFGESMETLGMPLDMEKDVYPHAQERAAEKIKKHIDNSLEPENKGEGIVRIQPKPSTAIAEYAEEEAYDLIVMAAKGAHESDLLRGSITEKIIRHSNVPVLTIPKGGSADIGTILVPTDGSQPSLKALPMAISVALNHDADIILFHVLELHGSITENAPRNPDKSKAENIIDAIYNAIDNFFEDSWNKAELRRGEGYKSQFIVSHGASSTTINVKTVIEKAVSAHHSITEYGNEQADLIVMSTLGHSGLAHLLLGSTAEKVTRHSMCRVLTVKPNYSKVN